MSINDNRAISAEVTPDEKLLWWGKPMQGVRLRKSDTIMIPFSLMWGGFAFFWEYQVIQTNAPGFFKLWGIPFVLVGLYMIFGRFIVDEKSREKTYYGLTTKRVIIVTEFLGRKVKTLSLKNLQDINLSESQDRTGTITFGSPGINSMIGAWQPFMYKNIIPSFEFIENSRDVYERILRAQNEG